MTKKQTIARRVLPGLLGCTALALSAGIALAEPTGTITASSPYPTQSLNPTGSTSADLGTALASKALFDTLLIRKGDQFIPSLATEWSANEDGTAYTFKLRDDVTFHDGSPLTAKDVAASIKLSSETPGPLAALWKPVSAEVVDDFTVTLNLERPMGALLSNLSTLEILPADLMGNEDYWNAPIGSGPFKYNAFNPGQELRLDAYEDYWDGAPKAAHLVLRVIPEISSRLAALETGEIDATWNVPDDLLPELEGNADLSIEMVPSLSSYVLWFNPSEGPLLRHARAPGHVACGGCRKARERPAPLLRQGCQGRHHAGSLRLCAADPLRLRSGESESASRRGRLSGRHRHLGAVLQARVPGLRRRTHLRVGQGRHQGQIGRERACGLARRSAEAQLET